ncbi:MAG: PD-(D/E)XK nuclease family protein [Limisphaerales bacterium]
MTLIDRQAPSHWYLRDGRPFHEIAKKDGSGNRAVTLADARKVLALPSVTNILGVIAKPGLEAWKIEQGIMAALTLPALPGEPIDAYARRVVNDMDAQVEKAADFGTAIHAACELYAREKLLPSDPTLLAFIEPWRVWFDENVERVECIETIFVSLEHGYAGRVDMIAKLKDIGWCVVDFKTQKVKRSSKGEAKPAFYETWPLQLAAYAFAAEKTLAQSIPGMVSVVIDSLEPGPVHIKHWDSVQPHLHMFTHLLDVWKYVKCYDPTPDQFGPCREWLN